jgi:hypothetical protein
MPFSNIALYRFESTAPEKTDLSLLIVSVGAHHAEHERDSGCPDQRDETEMARTGDGVAQWWLVALK